MLQRKNHTHYEKNISAASYKKKIMISITGFQPGIEQELWEVFYSAIHDVCIKDYSIEQVSAWAPKDFESSIWASKMASISPFVAYIDSKVVGYADLQGCGKIDHFFVHGDYQSRGVGSALMRHILEKAICFERVYSEVSHTAKPFYERHGFTSIKKQTFTVRKVQLQNNLMQRIQSK